jgi:hypothetical protein
VRFGTNRPRYARPWPGGPRGKWRLQDDSKRTLSGWWCMPRFTTTDPLTGHGMREAEQRSINSSPHALGRRNEWEFDVLMQVSDAHSVAHLFCWICYSISLVEYSCTGKCARQIPLWRECGPAADRQPGRSDSCAAQWCVCLGRRKAAQKSDPLCCSPAAEDRDATRTGHGEGPDGRGGESSGARSVDEDAEESAA